MGSPHRVASRTVSHLVAWGTFPQTALGYFLSHRARNPLQALSAPSRECHRPAVFLPHLGQGVVEKALLPLGVGIKPSGSPPPPPASPLPQVPKDLLHTADPKVEHLPAPLVIDPQHHIHRGSVIRPTVLWERRCPRRPPPPVPKPPRIGSARSTVWCKGGGLEPALPIAGDEGVPNVRGQEPF